MTSPPTAGTVSLDSQAFTRNVSRETLHEIKSNMTFNSFFTRALLVSVVALPLVTSAAINKCTGTDGKVVFSDQPCAPSQIATTVKDGGSAKPGAVTSKPTDLPTGTKPTLDSMDAMLTPECRQLRKEQDEKIKAVVAGRLTQADLQRVQNRFESQCVPLIKAAQDAEWAKGKGERDKLQKQLECTDKRRVYNERKDRLASLDDSGRKAMAAIALDLDTNCR